MIKKIIIIGVIASIFFISILAFIFYHKVSSPKSHRLRWWLTDIDWDGSRHNLTGKNVTIALVDTGVDFTHKDLKECEHIEMSVIGLSKGDTNHGTAIAGIICGMPSDSKGILGIAPKSKLISIDTTNEETVKTESLIKGIQTAISNNVDIINISVGVKEDNIELYNCIKEAYKKNIIIVASAGNYMENEILYPAAYDEVVAVGAYDKNKNIISPKGNVQNVIFLPGKNIATCISDNKYAGVQGTSFSTAIMTGILALVKQQYPNIKNDILYKKIYEVANKNNRSIQVDSWINIMKE